MTIFAVVCAGIFPVFHVGRVWYAWFLFPIPNSNYIWPQLPLAARVGRVRGLDLRHGLRALLVRRHDPRPGDAARPFRGGGAGAQARIYGVLRDGLARLGPRTGATTRWPT